MFLFVNFYQQIHIFDFTGCLLPHALHLMKLKSPSLVSSVSGFPQSEQRTNSCAYCLIFAFTLLAANLEPRIRKPPRNSPGVASSLSVYLSKWSAGRRNTLAICTKFDIAVLFPSKCPFTFGISKRSFSKTLAGRCSRARLSNWSYSIVFSTDCRFINRQSVENTMEYDQLLKRAREHLP